MTKMIAQCTQQGQTIEQAMDWAAGELEGFSRSSSGGGERPGNPVPALDRCRA